MMDILTFLKKNYSDIVGLFKILGFSAKVTQCSFPTPKHLLL
jgi:hypothetical protein